MQEKPILPSGNLDLLLNAWKHWNRSVQNTIIGLAMLNQDFKEFIGLLNANNVRYLVVGGYAVALHGFPRYTNDLDIWIESKLENAENMIRVLASFGFGSLGLEINDFLQDDQVIQLGYPPNRIDLLLMLSGVDFPQCYSSRIEIEVDGVKLNLIDLENLKKNKKACGRYQDLADLENLSE